MGYEGAPLLSLHRSPPIPDERGLAVPPDQTLAPPVTTDVSPRVVTSPHVTISTFVQIQLLHPGKTQAIYQNCKNKINVMTRMLCYTSLVLH